MKVGLGCVRLPILVACWESYRSSIAIVIKISCYGDKGKRITFWHKGADH
jgi:hypothetical protein